MRLIALFYCLFFFPALAFAQPQDSLQNEETDTLGVQSPQKGIKYRNRVALNPNRLHIGVDLYPLAVTAVEEDFQGATVHVGLSLADRFWVQADAGYEDNNRQTNSSPFYEYQTSGNFFRLGADYNLSYWKSPRDAFLMGVHFGYASFDQTVSYSSTNQTWRHIMEEMSAQGVSCTWVEPRFTLQVRAFDRLSMEAVLGLRVRAGLSGYAVFPNEVPGLGVLKSRARLSFGYRLCYALDF